jgi:hypothetical protein
VRWRGGSANPVFRALIQKVLLRHDSSIKYLHDLIRTRNK